MKTALTYSIIGAVALAIAVPTIAVANGYNPGFAPAPTPAVVITAAEPNDDADFDRGAAIDAAEADKAARDAEAARIAAEAAAAAQAAADAAAAAAAQAAADEAARAAADTDSDASDTPAADDGIPAGAWPLPWIPSSDPNNAQGGQYDFTGCNGADTINGVPYCTH